MSKVFVLLLSMNIFLSLSFGQNKYSLKGEVVDENNQSLAGASVFLYPIAEGSITDQKGSFFIGNLKKGEYKIEISFIGYKTISDTILINGEMTYNAKLNVSLVNLQEVVVTDHYGEKRKKEEPLNIEIVNDDYLKQNLGGSLMQSLERLPGVTTIDIGSGQSKPVIRGLSFNRVVVVDNGIKHEAQQWGADHGLEIDQYAVDNIEIIKGPASLMYGSDAIGGIINMKSSVIVPEDCLGGTIDLVGKSNNNLVGSSILLFGRKKWFYADFRATYISYGDYKAPTDHVDIYNYPVYLYNNQLRNTAGKEQNHHLSVGILKPKFRSKFYLNNVYNKSGFFANAHGLEPKQVDTVLHDKSSRDIIYPYHHVNHFKITNTSEYKWSKTKLEADLGFQQNFRQEWSQYVSHGWMPAVFPDTLSFDQDLERQFKKYVYSGNVKMNHELTGKTNLLLGVNSEFQQNQIDGRAFIIPAFTQISLGGYALAKHSFSGRAIYQMGIRYDYGNINTDEYYDWFPSQVVIDNDTTYQYLQRADDIDREFSEVTWSAGFNYNTEKWSFKGNLGKSFRMPTAKELAANGPEYHMYMYVVGDANLAPEKASQLDLGAEYNSSKFAIGITPFVNYFSNYIYLNPTSDHDRNNGAGLQIFRYTQSKVFRYGGEIHAHYQLLKPLQIGVIGEYVYSEQLSGEKKGYTLPFSPPASAILNVKYQRPKMGFMENNYLSVDYRLTAPQNNVVAPEEPTDGYQVINIGLGGDVKLKSQRVNISIQVQNLLNNKYFNHTSYYRLINLPEPGRNFIVNLSIPFTGKIK